VSYLFNGSTSNLDLSAAVVSAYPATFSCWINPTSAATNYTSISIDEKASVGGQDSFRQIPASSAICRTQVVTNGTAVNCDSTGAFQVGQFRNLVSVFGSATSRRSYLSGGFVGTNATSNTPTTLDTTNIGSRWITSAQSIFYSGLMAEVAIWNCALNDTDARNIAAGMSAAFVRPESLVLYLPLRGDTLDRSIFGRFFTNTACVPNSSHPNIWTPVGYDRPYLVGVPAAGGGGSKLKLNSNLNGLGASGPFFADRLAA
jgi:hypothetical protein